MRWCEGLPELGERPLRADERAAVARLARRLAWRIAARLALAAAAPVAAFALVVLGIAVVGAPDAAPRGAARDALEVAGAVLFVAGFLVGPAAALLAARDRWRDLRRVRLDRAAGVAVEFGDGARALAVLPASGRVLARDARTADLAARATIGAAVPPPAEAPTYAISAGGLGGGEAREIVAHGLVRRPLSRGERDELRGHARGLRRIPWTVSLVALWWGMGVARWARGAEERTPLVGMLTLVLALGAWRLVRARALAARLDADAEEGWAIRATAGATSGDEALPASRAVWTTGGAPARWRTGERRR